MSAISTSPCTPAAPFFFFFFFLLVGADVESCFFFGGAAAAGAASAEDRGNTSELEWLTVCHSGCGSITGDRWCSSTFHPGLLLLHVLQLFQQLPLLLPRQSDVGSRARPDTKHRVRQHVLFWRSRSVSRPTLCPDSCHSLSLLQVMDGDETLVDHGAHDLMSLPLLSAQNSPPLEKLLTEFLQREDKMNRHDE